MFDVCGFSSYNVDDDLVWGIGFMELENDIISLIVVKQLFRFAVVKKSFSASPALSGFTRSAPATIDIFLSLTMPLYLRAKDPMVVCFCMTLAVCSHST